MNADKSTIVDLLTTLGWRFIVPVYQRPYSWNDEQCEQLWADVLSAGRQPVGYHFTGSIVWVQGGVAAAAGSTPRLLIDGQQRVTTIMLMLIALARYFNSHDDPDMAEEIINGYIVIKHGGGTHEYRLALTQNDDETLRTLIDNTIDLETPICQDSQLLIRNLRFFERHIEDLGNPMLVLSGIKRLQVVSVSLDQGQDNPQLIFESMNSTGKDLSTADLVRNYVLMGLPLDDQSRLYERKWRPIEKALGNNYDGIFDDFLHDWLTVVDAEPTSSKNMYAAFKRHAQASASAADASNADASVETAGQMSALLDEILRYARHWAAIMKPGEVPGGEFDDLPGSVRAQLLSLHELNTAQKITTATPLMVFLLDAFTSGRISEDDLTIMLRDIESFMFRRMICGVGSNGLNKFLPSIIGRLAHSDVRGEDFRKLFELQFTTQKSAGQRFPTDEEFRQNLTTNDCYAHSGRCKYMLGMLENSWHPKNPLDFMAVNDAGKPLYTIEHIMPQNATHSEQWRAMLGSNWQHDYDQYINNLGNLTLTAYNSELSDASFEEKKQRIIGGYDNDYLHISADLKDTDVWNASTIQARMWELADQAVKVWARPAEQSTDAAAAEASTDSGDSAHADVSATQHDVTAAATGIAERHDYKTKKAQQLVHDRIAFWQGLYQYVDDRQDTAAAFGGKCATRKPNDRGDTTFKIPWSGCWLTAAYQARTDIATVGVYCETDAAFARLTALRPHIEQLATSIGDGMKWGGRNGDAKSFVITQQFSSMNEGEPIYHWMADSLLALRDVMMNE